MAKYRVGSQFDIYWTVIRRIIGKLYSSPSSSLTSLNNPCFSKHEKYGRVRQNNNFCATISGLIFTHATRVSSTCVKHFNEERRNREFPWWNNYSKVRCTTSNSHHPIGKFWRHWASISASGRKMCLLDTNTDRARIERIVSQPVNCTNNEFTIGRQVAGRGRGNNRLAVPVRMNMHGRHHWQRPS